MASKNWKTAGQGSYNPMINVKKDKGQVTEGVYDGSKEVTVDGDISIVHTILIKGAPNDFWGTGALNFKLKEVPKGSEVKITYLGTVKTKVKIKGREVTKEIHDFEVLYC